MAGAEQSVIVDVPPDVLFGVIADYEKYPEFLNDMAGARVIESGDGFTVAEFTLNLIKTVRYTIRLTETPPERVSWTLIESNLLKVNNGGWTLEALPGDRTRATYRLEVTIGRFVPKMISNRLTGKTLPATLKAFKERAEGLDR
ncbi:MAG: SRPBCC family protein [Deltaproteobacteria bacterium]|nr:SRPBCC family protein [Deltaproteobacteria bacterium]